VGATILTVLAGCGFRIASSTDGMPNHDATDEAAAGDDAAIDAATDAPADAPADVQIIMIDASVDSPPPTCSGTGLVCPGGTTPHAIGCGTGCWYGCRDGSAVTETAASALCTAWGGTLGRIDSAADETCMRTILDGAIWLGLEQAANQMQTTTGWTWNSDGIAPPYLRWASGQPNDGDGTEDGLEQCVYSSTSTTWQDTPCTALFSRFSCRK
jgi:hypothetical protein